MTEPDERQRILATEDAYVAAEVASDEAVSTLRYTATYVRRGDDWRLLALQMQPRAKG
jgi:hypothetical protein